ncbi:MAG: sulfate transporter [Rhodospirillaceae bacterium]|nr:sulfate transporter [Rhodospirillaceae bacterium]
MTSQSNATIPPGYMEDAQGHLVPRDKVKPLDLDRDKTVKDLVRKAKKASADLAEFKAEAFAVVEAFLDRSAAEYDAKIGGAGGNVTLTTYDGRFKVQRAVSKNISFDERLQAAKALIDECIREWSKGANKNIQVLVQDAFQVDKQGNVSTERVLGLRRLKVEDDRWDRAMKAISDSLQVIGSKSYIRVYERAADGTYMPISLDVASVDLPANDIADPDTTPAETAAAETADEAA